MKVYTENSAICSGLNLQLQLSLILNFVSVDGKRVCVLLPYGTLRERRSKLRAASRRERHFEL
ncbi:hypothetical protein [Nostoc sp.]|uniref:hypothetical protein n=1 Tax=Nostoc sp. TaxID=1180 RepID=UPI002FF7C8FF